LREKKANVASLRAKNQRKSESACVEQIKKNDVFIRMEQSTTNEDTPSSILADSGLESNNSTNTSSSKSDMNSSFIKKNELSSSSLTKTLGI